MILDTLYKDGWNQFVFTLALYRKEQDSEVQDFRKNEDLEKFADLLEQRVQKMPLTKEA